MKKEKLKNKKGSHVGTVISFVVFLTFLLFFYIISQPVVSYKKENKIIFEKVKSEIEERINYETVISLIEIEDFTGNSECIRLKSFFEKTKSPKNTTVKDDQEIIISDTPRSNSNDLILQKNNHGKITVYASESLDKTGEIQSSDCTSIDYETGYNIKTVKKDFYSFENRILTLLKDYQDDYEKLKKEMEIFEGDNFGFSFIYENGTEIGTAEKNIK